MDISQFSLTSDFSYRKCYTKCIEKYELKVYTGNWVNQIVSVPADSNLDINDYIQVMFEINTTLFSKELLSLTDPNLKPFVSSLTLGPFSFDKYCCFLLSIPELEMVVSNLQKYLTTSNPIVNTYIISKSSRQEKPCKVCGKMNDIGVSSCWMCGSEDPTFG